MGMPVEPRQSGLQAMQVLAMDIVKQFAVKLVYW